jgi:hypothetical protein
MARLPLLLIATPVGIWSEGFAPSPLPPKTLVQTALAGLAAVGSSLASTMSELPAEVTSPEPKFWVPNSLATMYWLPTASTVMPPMEATP